MKATLELSLSSTVLTLTGEGFEDDEALRYLHAARVRFELIALVAGPTETSVRLYPV